MTTYLVDHLSFSRHEAESISARYLFRLTSTSKLYLFSSLLLRSPPSCASSFGYSLPRFSSSVRLLRSLLSHDDARLVSALCRCPHLLTNDPVSILSRNAAILRSRGLRSSSLADFIQKCPVALIVNPLQLLSAFDLIKREFGIGNQQEDDDDSDYVSTASLAASALGLPNKVEMLRRYGFRSQEMFVLFRRCPTRMWRRSWGVFFREKVRAEPRELLNNTWVPMFSPEKRLMPRYRHLQGLKERGLVPLETSLLKPFAMTKGEYGRESVGRFRDGEGSDRVPTVR